MAVQALSSSLISPNHALSSMQNQLSALLYLNRVRYYVRSH